MITVANNTGTKLSYGLTVTPSPLQASLDTATTSATIQIIGVNQTGGVLDMESLVVEVSIGANASDLSDQTTTPLDTSITPSSDWLPTEPAGGPGPNKYTWNPSDPPLKLEPDDSVVITFTDVPVNTMLGTTGIKITETERSNGPNSITFELTKFPYGFYFTDLAAYDLNGLPVAQVLNGKQVLLKWSGSLTEVSGYKVYYNTNAGQFSSTVTTLGQWTSPPLAASTVFTVQATAEPVTSQLQAAVACRTRT